MSREISCVHRARKLGTREVRRAFLVMVLELSLFQTGVNLVSAATQISMAGLAMYPLTAAVLLAFMRRQIASARVVLGERTLVLERRLGDRVTQMREIPLRRILSVRPFVQGEDLRLIYRSVSVMDDGARRSPRVNLGMFLSGLSGRLARKVAGGEAFLEAGMVVVYQDEEDLRACTFVPDERMKQALGAALGDAYLRDDRLGRPQVLSMKGQLLEHAFPEIYRHCAPLVTPEDLAWAARERENSRKRREERREARLRRAEREQGLRSGKEAAPKKKKAAPGKTRPDKGPRPEKGKGMTKKEGRKGSSHDDNV